MVRTSALEVRGYRYGPRQEPQTATPAVGATGFRSCNPPLVQSPDCNSLNREIFPNPPHSAANAATLSPRARAWFHCLLAGIPALTAWAKSFASPGLGRQ